MDWPVIAHDSLCNHLLVCFSVSLPSLFNQCLTCNHCILYLVQLACMCIYCTSCSSHTYVRTNNGFVIVEYCLPMQHSCRCFAIEYNNWWPCTDSHCMLRIYIGKHIQDIVLVAMLTVPLVFLMMPLEVQRRLLCVYRTYRMLLSWFSFSYQSLLSYCFESFACF